MTYYFVHVIMQVFTGNKSNCLRVHYQIIKRIVELTSQHGGSALSYLELLKALVKVGVHVCDVSVACNGIVMYI